MNWIAVLKSDGSLPGDRPNLVIYAERWFDARAYALAKMGEDAEVFAGSVDFEPEVELSWRGSDFNNSGERQLWVRERGKGWVKA